jgi:hypothetical protein
MRYNIQLQANVRAKQFFRGKMVAIMDVGAASGVNLQLFGGGGEQAIEDFGEVGKNFGVYSPDAHYTGAEFLSTVNTTIEIIVTNSRVEVIDGANLTVTISPTSLPLETIDQPASAFTDAAAVPVAALAVQIMAASATRIEARIANIGIDPMAIGAVGLTWAKRNIVLLPGDVWVETRAPQLAWYGICDTGKTASATVQELTA